MPTSTARIRRGSSGFTLLESLVALAIAALVLTSLYGAVTRVASVRRRTAETAKRVTATRTLLLDIAREVEAALAPDAPAAPERFVVTTPDDAAPPWSALRFATRGRSDADTPDLVSYHVEPRAPGRGVIVRRVGSRFAPADRPEPRGIEALGDVVRFGIRCFDGATWRSSWTAPELPRAVELDVVVDDGAGGTEELRTAVTLPLGTS